MRKRAPARAPRTDTWHTYSKMKNLSFDQLPNAVAGLMETTNKLAEMVENQQKTLGMILNGQQKQQPASDADRWMNIYELVDYLPEHPKFATIYQWVHARRIPCYKGSKMLQFRKSEIDKWLSQNRRLTEQEMNQMATRLPSQKRSRP